MGLQTEDTKILYPKSYDIQDVDAVSTQGDGIIGDDESLNSSVVHDDPIHEVIDENSLMSPCLENVDYNTYKSQFLEVAYVDGQVLMKLNIPGAGGIPYPPFEVVEDDLHFVIALSEELAKEFIRRNYDNNLKIQYTTKAAFAKRSLNKALQDHIKCLFSVKMVNSLKPKQDKPKKVKIPKVKRLKEKKIKIKKIKEKKVK